MKKLSFWASRNVWPARILLLCAAILLHTLAISLGDLARDTGLRISWIWIYPVAAASVYAFVFYPFSGDKHRYKKYYTLRKTFDGVLVVSTFLMLFIGAINGRQFIPMPETVNISYTDAVSAVEKPPKEKKNRKLSPRKKLKENLQILKKLYKKGTPAEKIALIFLAIVVTAGLLFLLMALSCSLACNGSDAAAVLVGLAGTGLIIFLFVRVLRGLNRKYPRGKEERGER